MKYWIKRMAAAVVICACIVGMTPGDSCLYAQNTEAAAAAGETEKTEVKKSVEKPVLSKTSLEIRRGKKKKLKVKKTSKKVKWASSNKKIASVSSGGVVKGVSCGTVKITATVGGKKLTCKVVVYASKKNVKKWIEKDGRYYYYNQYGEKATGRCTINKKTYFFDAKGRQRTGWMKIKGSYYYFRTANKGKGYMVKGTKVNGIKINSKGKAKITSKTKEKVRLLTAANAYVFSKTKSTMKRSEKLKILYTGLATNKTISYRNLTSFKKNDSRWDETYAAYFFDRGYGDCYVAGCALAYMATAIGYDNVYAESSGGHGWAKIAGKYYDPNWAWWGTKGDIYKAYAVPRSLSGKGGRQPWAACEVYVKKIS